jgi:hypothetical protein
VPEEPYVTQREIDQRFAAHDRAVQAALASAKEAVDKAETNAEKWRNSANEWRGAMGDRERDFLTRREFYVMIVTACAVITLAALFWKR